MGTESAAASVPDFPRIKRDVTEDILIPDGDTVLFYEQCQFLGTTVTLELGGIALSL